MIPTNVNYHKKQYVWTYVRDALDGESAVKRENTKYLPMPTAMAEMPPSPSQSRQNSASNDFAHGMWDAPHAHSNKAYEAYLQRARYPMLVAHTVRSLTGVAMRKPPTITLPKHLEYLAERLEKVYRKIVSNSLSYGRVWLVVEVTDDGKFDILVYKALSGVDWKEDKYVVFREHVDETGDAKEDFEFVRLIVGDSEDGVVYQTQRVNGDAEDFENAEVKVPSYSGKTLERLPVVCCGSLDTEWTVDPIPMEGICSCAGQIYMKNADLSQAEYMSCNPMLVFLNVAKKDVPTAVGSSVALTLPGDTADAKYVEPSGASLNHMLTTLDRLYEEASQYGAQLLGASKSQVESGDALRLRQNASGATLLSVMQVGSEAVNKLLDVIAEWSGTDRSKMGFEHESDLADVVLTPHELSELTKTWMAGGISYETYFSRLQKGGVIDEDKTAEEERAQIEQEAPNLILPTDNEDDKDKGKDGDDDDPPEDE